ncbi:esterase/lipase family protein [Umezawaea beigongshangensis]|uniref:esterase/lipase family protein n=1 Tax=Umezawaea beigongshangensis TaxID=2780383 RepID=UPI0018F117BC|nr:lipase [Umezawaea beigongshangensis]
MKRLLVLVATALLASPLSPVASASGGSTGPYAPIDRPGPRLSVPVADLQASVTCTPSAYGSHREVVLLVPGTGASPADAYSWNWFAALDEAGHPYCAVTPPGNAVGDVQVSAEYVVHAIRHTRAISRGKIAVLGHSQGGVSSRFALRFWPDTRAMVADHVGFAAVNHGSVQNDIAYPDGNGPAFNLQLKTTAAFVDATNSGRETFPGISYTSLSTTHDQFVTPAGTTDLSGPAGRVANISLQDVCPANTSDHLGIGTSDALAHALAMNAITRPGPANPAEVPASVCAQELMPGVDPHTHAADLAAFTRTITDNIARAEVVATEPALKPHVFARR